jgi:hypothetical protein
MPPTPLCSLSDYRQIVADLARPTDQQIENFVEYVSQGHSWYKHLPLLPPGVPFCFFIDPFAGYDHKKKAGSDWAPVERTEDSARLHYTSMPTSKYHLKFGHLSYDVGAQAATNSVDTDQSYARLPTFFTSQGSQHIPLEVADAGSAEITAPIHPLTARIWIWYQFMEVRNSNPELASLRWPSETGGDQTMQKIEDLCQQREDESGEKHAQLGALLLPERERLQTNITQAIGRSLDLIFP